MGILAHVLKTLAFLLNRVVAGAETIDLKLTTLYLRGLTCALTFHQCTHDIDAGTGSNALQHFLIKLLRIDNHLNILDGRAIIKRYEVNRLATTMGPHPSLHEIGRASCRERV